MNKLFKLIFSLVLIILAYIFNEQEKILDYGHTLSDTYQVYKVHDGDTLTLIKNNEKIKVRLFAIDAPELSQPYGKAARSRVIELIEQQTLKLEVQYKDQYKRSVAKVFLENGSELNKVLVSEGLAYWYQKLAVNRYDLKEVEERARKQKLGVWSVKTIPPWEYRKSKEFMRN